MNKVVINSCYGGFSLSREAVLLAREMTSDPRWYRACIKGDKYDDGEICSYDYGYVYVPRHDPILVRVVEELGEKASGQTAKLVVERISSNKYRIEEYDGFETVITPDTNFDWIEI